MVVGRYAPSPTGPLHHGNLRTALLAWLQARLSDGILLLRIDDLDPPRNQPGSVEQLIDDLQWLGIDWHGEPYLQSEHLADYESAFEKLALNDLIYPCRCSRKDIALAASAPHSSEATTVYPGTCRPQSVASSNPSLDQSEALAWRFQVAKQRVEFKDELQGSVFQQLDTEAGDFVVKRKDGLFAYQLASVVDDVLMKVTDVLRGEDLIDSTPRQLSLFDALDQPIPHFWHVPLMTGERGERMSKRNGADSLINWRNSGKSAQAYIGFLAHSAGLIESPEALSCEQLASRLTLNRFREKLKR